MENTTIRILALIAAIILLGFAVVFGYNGRMGDSIVALMLGGLTAIAAASWPNGRRFK